MSGKALFFFLLASFFAVSDDSHDDFLPGGVVGDVADLFLLLCDPLHGLHDFLEHGSLPDRREDGGVLARAKRQTRGVAVGGGAVLLALYLLEVKGEIGGDDADFKQVLDGFKLPLLEVLEDVQVLQKTKKNSSDAAKKIKFTAQRK